MLEILEGGGVNKTTLYLLEGGHINGIFFLGFRIENGRHVYCLSWRLEQHPEGMYYRFEQAESLTKNPTHFENAIKTL